jgi:putative ABC transport system permease protein
MFKFLPYVLKNLRGYRVRTSMTVGGTAVLMFLFLFVSSIQEGMRRLLDQRDDKLIVYQAYRFCPSSSLLPVFYEDAIRSVPGVKEVLPVKVVVNNCRASLDTVLFHGVKPEQLARARGHFRFLHGNFASLQERPDAALVGRKIAERRGLKPGQSFTVAGITVTVTGIFASDYPGEESIIYTPLALLQGGQHNEELHVTFFEVHPTNPEQAAQVAQAIDEKIRDRFQILTETKPQSAHYAGLMADLIDLIGMTRWLGYVCVGVVVVLVANAVIMAAQDRVKEHAVLQTIGFSGRKIFGLMLSESLLVSILGGTVGIAAGMAWLTWQPFTLSTEGVSIDFVASPALALWSLAMAVGVGLLAGIIPAWQAGRAEIVTSLR